jgi:hypothetical protein
MKESHVKIKYLKVDKNTDWLSYQRKLPKEGFYPVFSDGSE